MGANRITTLRLLLGSEGGEQKRLMPKGETCSPGPGSKPGIFGTGSKPRIGVEPGGTDSV